jgi:hypothetical protein
MERAMSVITFTTFAQVQQALDNFVNANGYPVGQAPHKVFWHRGMTPDQQYVNFITGDAIPGVPIIKKDGPNSNVILALSGLPPFDGTDFQQMPIGGPPFLDQPTIDAISAWISAGAKQ